MQNLMNEYIKIVKSNMNEFIKAFIENKYVKYLSDEFIDTYVETRYYGLIEIKKGFTVKNKILGELRDKKDELIEKEPQKEKIIELIYDFFDSAIAFNEYKDETLNEEIEQVINLRKIHLGKNDDEDYKELLHNLVIKCGKDKEKLLELTDSNKFFLKLINTKITNLKRVVIKYNLKFPAVYSKASIQKAFNNGIIAEDKLFVEYNQIAAQIIRDVESGIYRKQYLVEFMDSLLEKPQKLNRVLEIINHSSIQDRVILRIGFNAAQKNKDKIYELLRNGYKFAIEIEGSFECTSSNIQRLSLFEYVIVSKRLQVYKSLVREKLDNIIEI